jgi:hypothetical protein
MIHSDQGGGKPVAIQFAVNAKAAIAPPAAPSELIGIRNLKSAGTGFFNKVDGLSVKPLNQ